MIIKIKKSLLQELLKQVMANKKNKKEFNDIQKQILYQKRILNDMSKTQRQKLDRFHRLRTLQMKYNLVQQDKQKQVMPGIGNAGQQLKKQGGLAKAIFPFKSKKVSKPKKKDK